MPTVPDDRKAAMTDEATAAAEPEGKEAAYYCPGCGKRSDVKGECTGTAESGHAPIAYVSTKELAGDPDKHTAAPNTDG